MKAVSDIFSPVTGKILKVNEGLKNDPSVINKSPEKDGWIAEMTVDNQKEMGKF